MEEHLGRYGNAEKGWGGVREATWRKGCLSENVKDELNSLVKSEERERMVER